MWQRWQSIGIRTASHAFSPPKDPLPAGLVAWPEFDHKVLGGNYHGHYDNGLAKAPRTRVRVVPTTTSNAVLTGIPAEDIVQLARDYAALHPAVIRVNYGIQRSERGGAAVRAIAALPALTGSWKDAGGGLQLTTSQAFHFNSPALEMPELQMRSTLAQQRKSEARIVNMSELGKALPEAHVFF